MIFLWLINIILSDITRYFSLDIPQLGECGLMQRCGAALGHAQNIPTVGCHMLPIGRVSTKQQGELLILIAHDLARHLVWWTGSFPTPQPKRNRSSVTFRLWGRIFSPLLRLALPPPDPYLSETCHPSSAIRSIPPMDSIDSAGVAGAMTDGNNWSHPSLLQPLQPWSFHADESPNSAMLDASPPQRATMAEW